MSASDHAGADFVPLRPLQRSHVPLLPLCPALKTKDDSRAEHPRALLHPPPFYTTVSSLYMHVRGTLNTTQIEMNKRNAVCTWPKRIRLCFCVILNRFVHYRVTIGVHSCARSSARPILSKSIAATSIPSLDVFEIPKQQLSFSAPASTSTT